MYESQNSNYYAQAYKSAMREYSKSISKGQSGYLPSLEGLIKNNEIFSEVNLGIMEIPLKKIVGTYTHMRSMSFAGNFMPLMKDGTEFSSKWVGLSMAHVNDGIRDPIKVYEYLNWFYVIEGNKRVSVLKYFDAYSIHAEVQRLIPKMDENDINIKIYYEFLPFYQKTKINFFFSFLNWNSKINSIWFSREGGFEQLLEYFDKFKFNIKKYKDINRYYFLEKHVYYHFRKIYYEIGGNKLNITTGDAFLEYIKVYGIPSSVSDRRLKDTLKKFLSELEALSSNELIDIQTEPTESGIGNVMSTISNLVSSRKKYKVAFAYAKSPKTSCWSYSHELGRIHIQKAMEDQITTSYIDNVPENEDAYRFIRRLAEKDNDVIFTTSPTFIEATLKVALEYPNIKFLNCSEAFSYKHVNTYFGRIYEPRFLTGIIAGAATKTDILGYVATYPLPEVICGINAFALGAKMVNPYVKVKVVWTHQWTGSEKSQKASLSLMDAGADIISHQNTAVHQDISSEFGIYSMVCGSDSDDCGPSKYLAVPIWNWGIFYEKILKNVLSDSWKTVADMFGHSSKLINFWWGMDSGVVDIIYSDKRVPIETQKLIELMKRMIINNAYHPFTGPIYDQKGEIMIPQDAIASNEQVLTMDWLVDVVEGDLPIISQMETLQHLSTETLTIEKDE